jgi:GTP-binding nuclear protein Ran
MPISAQMETQKPQRDLSFKIVFAGASGVGKSCFLRRHRTGEFASKHIHTLGCDVAALSFHTTRGLITFKVWDLDGQNREGYFLEAQGLVAFYDVNTEVTMDVALDIIGRYPSLATVLCANKSDLKTTTGLIYRPKELNPNTPYFEISARSNYNFEKPFLALARKLTGDAELEFIESPALTPPDISTIEKDLFAAFDEELTYTVGPQDGYDSLGEPLRDSLEGLLVEAGCLGYTVVVQVKASLKKV